MTATTKGLLEERVIDLEIRLTYQDRLLAELNEVVVELRGEVERLTQRSRRFEEQLASGMPDDPGHQPPPHY
ncbi:MAG: SlyX family protein [Deltaproteobacteria bacterium]|nr:SlyX family protein [Deltaproteobacteria bacterium]